MGFIFFLFSIVHGRIKYVSLLLLLPNPFALITINLSCLETPVSEVFKSFLKPLPY